MLIRRRGTQRGEKRGRIHDKASLGESTTSVILLLDNKGSCCVTLQFRKQRRQLKTLSAPCSACLLAHPSIRPAAQGALCYSRVRPSTAEELRRKLSAPKRQEFYLHCDTRCGSREPHRKEQQQQTEGEGEREGEAMREKSNKKNCTCHCHSVHDCNLTHSPFFFFFF